MKDKELFIQVEKSMQKRALRTAIPQKVSPYIEQAVLAREKSAKETGTLYSYVCEKMKRQSRFTKKNGKLDESGFYIYARIDKTTWSNMRWNLRTPSKETLLKLVFALKLDEEEAEELLKRGSNSLNEQDPRDRVVLALIDVRCYEIESVYEVLEEYGKNGAEPFKNIY